MRGSLVPLAVCVVASCPRCRSIPSFERFLSVPCCRTVRALITLRRLCIWRVAPMGGVAPTRRGTRCPRSRFRPRGPNSPRLPPGFARRAVVGLCPPFLSAPASPQPSAARAMGAASPCCKGRRLFAGAFRVAGGWGVRLPGRFYPSGVCRFYRSLAPMGCSGLRFAPLGAPHRLAPVRQTSEGAPWQTHAFIQPLTPETPYPA